MTGGHNKVEYFSRSRIKESSFRSKDLSFRPSHQPEARPRAHNLTRAGSAGRTSPKGQYRS